MSEENSELEELKAAIEVLSAKNRELLGELRVTKAKAKGAKAGGGTIMIAIPSGAKAGDAANKLRAGFEKLRAASDDLAKLAAFLVDALDDAGFPESDE